MVHAGPDSLPARRVFQLWRRRSILWLQMIVATHLSRDETKECRAEKEVNYSKFDIPKPVRIYKIIKMTLQ